MSIRSLVQLWWKPLIRSNAQGVPTIFHQELNHQVLNVFDIDYSYCFSIIGRFCLGTQAGQHIIASKLEKGASMVCNWFWFSFETGICYLEHMYEQCTSKLRTFRCIKACSHLKHLLNSRGITHLSEPDPWFLELCQLAGGCALFQWSANMCKFKCN